MDPRLEPTPADLAPEPAPALAAADARPLVAQENRTLGLWAIGAGALALGVVTFLVLSGGHKPSAQNTTDTSFITAPATTGGYGAAPPPASTTPDFSALEAAGRGQGAQPQPMIVQAPPPVIAQAPAPAPVVVAAAAPVPPPLSAAEEAKQREAAAASESKRREAPSIVVDLDSGSAGAGTAAGAGPAGAPSAAGVIGTAAAASLTASGRGGPGGSAASGGAAGAEKSSASGDEQFIAKVSSAATGEPGSVRATMIRNQWATIAEGTIVPGVLETALNSDLPGYARAVISRDVRSFDGRTVLIPRGSRVIGEYRSAVALGTSRAFVIWSRIIRPDGGSVRVAFSGTDQLGRAGLEGKVDRHFLQRFGGSVFLSVVNGGIAYLTRPSTGVYIGTGGFGGGYGGTGYGGAGGLGSVAQSAGEATSLATSALLPTNIAPTIKIAQGTPIRIFVARDVDFSSIEEPRR